MMNCWLICLLGIFTRMASSSGVGESGGEEYPFVIDETKVLALDKALESSESLQKFIENNKIRRTEYNATL